MYTQRKSYSAYQYKPIWHRVLIPSSGEKEFLQEQQVVGKHLNAPSSVHHLRVSKPNFKHLLLSIHLSHNGFFLLVFFFNPSPSLQGMKHKLYYQRIILIGSNNVKISATQCTTLHKNRFCNFFIETYTCRFCFSISVFCLL